MKKKLIAAILSVAMVASVVPATAFAATDGAAKAKTSAAQTKAAPTEPTALTLTLADAAKEYVKSATYAKGQTAKTGKVTFVMNTDKKVPFGGDVDLTIAKPAEVTGAGTWKIDSGTADAAETKTVEIDAAKQTSGFTMTLSDDSGNDTVITVSIEGLVFVSAEDAFDDAISKLPTESSITTDNYSSDSVKNSIKAVIDGYDAAYAVSSITSDQKKELDKKFEAALLPVLRGIDKAKAAVVANAIAKIPTSINTVTGDNNDKTVINTADASYTDLKPESATTTAVGSPYVAATPFKVNTEAALKDTVSNVQDLKDAKAALNIVETINTANAPTGKFKLPTSIAKATDFGDYNTAVTGIKTELDKMTAKQTARVGNLYIYTAASNNVKTWTDNLATMKTLAENLGKVTSVKTQAEITAAKDLIAKGDLEMSKADKLIDQKEYTDAKEILKKKIDAAEKGLVAEKDAAALIAQIKALPAAAALALTDMAKVDTVYYAYEQADADVKKLVQAEKADWTISTARDRIKALKLTASTDKAKYTQAVIDAYVTNADLTTKEAITAAEEAFKDAALDKNTAAYINANAKVQIASAQLKAEEENNKLAAATVVTLIKNLGSESSLGYKLNVETARKAYEALTDAQKELVTNYADLVSAEKAVEKIDKDTAAKEAANKAMVAYIGLSAAIKADPTKAAITDKDAIYGIRDLIELEGVREVFKANDPVALTTIDQLIIQIDKITAAEFDTKAAALVPLKADATQAEIEAAAKDIKALRAEYDGFSKGQKEQVKNAAKLTDAEKALETATINHSNAELKAIAAFDYEKELTADQLAQIKAEKACIDAMSPEQIAKLDKANYEIYLTKALKALADSEEAATSLEGAKIEGLKEVVYNGKAHTPEIKVTGKDGKEIAAEEYTVKYYSNKNVGQATVVVTAKKGGAYTGSTEATFIITPAKASITSLQVSKAKLRVNIKPMSNVNYRIAYKPTSAKSYKGQNTSLTSKVLPGIKAKTKYTVKVRAYIKEGGKTYFGAYSDLKRATTK